MGYIFMQISSSKYAEKNPLNYTLNRQYIHEHAASLAAAANGDSILIPAGVRDILVTLSVASGGAGKVQTTTSSYAAILAGTATWVDWDAGAVSANAQDVFYPVSAIRLVQTSVGGTTKLEVKAQ